MGGHLLAADETKQSGSSREARHRIAGTRARRVEEGFDRGKETVGRERRGRPNRVHREMNWESIDQEMRQIGQVTGPEGMPCRPVPGVGPSVG